jgi:glycosyltransferase involved in cell wall biosynthesis
VLTRRALTPVDGLVVHAESQRELANSQLGPTPVLVTPHPTYPVDIDARSRRRAPGDPTNLLFFGLIRQYKGVDVLLRALPMVLRERRVRLVVAGEFWEPTRSYTDLVDDLGIGDHVDLRPGYVPDADLMKLLSDADLVVAPYRTATTSAAVEMAFGAGLPVVASRVGGLADQVDHGVNGLLVPPDEPAALASALIEATAPASLDELTQHARADETIRTWDGLVEDVERFVRLLQDDTHPT